MNTTKLKSTMASKLKKLTIHLLIATAIAVPVRQCLATPVHVTTDAVAPELPNGSWALVYRLTSEFQPGDVVAYQVGSKLWVARYKSGTPSVIQLTRNNEQLEVPRNTAIGKVVLASR